MKRTVDFSQLHGLRSISRPVLALLLLAALLPVVAAPLAAAPLQSTMYQVYVTDVTAVSFVVTWTTDTPTDGTVEWDDNASLSSPTSVADPVASTTAHQVLVSGLSPSTTYYFQVKSGGITDNNNGDFYAVTTTSAGLFPPTPGKTVWGHVYEQNGVTAVPNALVYLQFQDNGGGGSTGNSQWVTARADASGVWSFDLVNIRTADGSAYFDFQDSTDNLRVVRQGGSKGVIGEDGNERVQLVPGSYPDRFDQPAEALDAMPEGSPIVGHDHWGETWSGSGTGLTLVSSSGFGLSGHATAASGWNAAVYGKTESTEGHGVFAHAANPNGYNYGVYGRTESTLGRGVQGYAAATTGWNQGVYGRTESIIGHGVLGHAANPNGYNYGVYGYAASTLGRGVQGYAAATSGSNHGVHGTTESIEGHGVFGYASANNGENYGVFGQTGSPDGWAGYFAGGKGVYVVGDIDASGTKHAVVRTADGSRRLYAEEAAEVWFADYGFGQLQDGAAKVPIDPIFAQTVNLDEPYHVFLQVYGDAEVYVSARTLESFEVRLREGDLNVEFSYRLVARRLGYEDQRLERAPWADDDPNLYPEKRAEWEARHALPASAMPEGPPAFTPPEVLPVPILPELPEETLSPLGVPEPPPPEETEPPVEGP